MTWGVFIFENFGQFYSMTMADDRAYDDLVRTMCKTIELSKREVHDYYGTKFLVVRKVFLNVKLTR